MNYRKNVSRITVPTADGVQWLDDLAIHGAPTDPFGIIVVLMAGADGVRID